jgi:hypothetical protein
MSILYFSPKLMEVGKFFAILMCLEVIPGSLWAEKDPCEVPSTSVTIQGDATIISE